MQKLQPIQIRDFHGGRYAGYSISNFLAPEYTVSDCLNVNFDTIIGPTVVRSGTTLFGAQVAANRTPLGMANFVTKKGTIYNRAIATFSGASTATVYYYDGTWHASNLTSLSNTKRVRYAMLGNQMFLVNGATFQSSADGGATWGTTNTTPIVPGIVIRAKARLLVSGDITATRSPSRVYFSSVIDPTTTPGSITWNTQATTGDWIDVNPDDGDSNTAFANTSTYTLVFKNQAMYRLDVVNKSVDTDNIFNLGTPSQEAVVSCQGVIYFFTGLDIRSTTGDFPQQISRLGVQDYIDAIPVANWTSVYGSTDGNSVWFFIGNITLRSGRTDQRSYTNVSLKFSPKDQSWSVHSYGQNFQAFTNITTTGLVGFAMIASDTLGNVQSLNNGRTDNGNAIFFEMTTQELDFGNRAHDKTIANQIVFFSQFGGSSSVEAIADDGDPLTIPSARNLIDRVTVAENVNITSFNFLKFRWFGNSVGTAPIFEGIYVEDITDDGIQ